MCVCIVCLHGLVMSAAANSVCLYAHIKLTHVYMCACLCDRHTYLCVYMPIADSSTFANVRK